ncbi:hypothetical protein QOT17_021664 [Balamuthia mandrillaris]
MKNTSPAPPSQPFPFLELPSELQLNALLWLAPLVGNHEHNNNNSNDAHCGASGKDLFHCHLVCKRFLEMLRGDYFWQTVLQTCGVVEEGCSSLPNDVHSWKEFYQLQFNHLEAAWQACNKYSGIVGYSSEPDSTPPPPHFQWFKDSNVIGICLDIDAGRLDYWYNGTYLTGLKAESIKQNGPYRAAVSLMKQGEKATFNFYARMPTTGIPSRSTLLPKEMAPCFIEDDTGLFAD